MTGPILPAPVPVPATAHGPTHIIRLKKAFVRNISLEQKYQQEKHRQLRIQSHVILTKVCNEHEASGNTDFKLQGELQFHPRQLQIQRTILTRVCNEQEASGYPDFNMLPGKIELAHLQLKDLLMESTLPIG